ncbi:MAG TPA: FAD-dependent monooxygenase [Bryobacteraceae bacterium]|nr:FAD-dependent monooxygenase [Bryobacteraceae bacterium]
MSPSELNFAIVGGGIGGVAAAIALHQRGCRVTLYERAPEIREVGAGMMLWPNATRVLRKLGVLDELLPLGGRTTNFLVRAQDGRVLMNIPLGQFDVPGICIRRSDLLAVLLAKLPADAIRLDHEFSRLEQNESSVRLYFKTGEVAEHSALFGADGIRSRVRAQIFGVIPPIHRGYIVWRGIARYSGAALDPRCNSETWGRGKRFGILHTGSDRVTWYAAANRHEHDLLEMFRDWHQPIADLIRDTEIVLRNPALDLAPLGRWSRGRVTLLGDAAHPCTPNLGQGCCMAIEDALTLAKCVAVEGQLDDAFARYERLRRGRTRHIQNRSRLMGRIGQFENRLFAAGRNAVTSLLPAMLFEHNLRRVYSYET